MTMNLYTDVGFMLEVGQGYAMHLGYLDISYVMIDMHSRWVVHMARCPRWCSWPSCWWFGRRKTSTIVQTSRTADGHHVPHGRICFWWVLCWFLGYMISSYDFMAFKTIYCLRYTWHTMVFLGDEPPMKGPSTIPVDWVLCWTSRGNKDV